MGSLVRLDRVGDNTLRMTLSAPRANALTQKFLDAMRAGLDAVDRADPRR